MMMMVMMRRRRMCRNRIRHQGHGREGRVVGCCGWCAGSPSVRASLMTIRGRGVASWVALV